MEAYELPLVFFTVLGQTAIGMLLFVSLLEAVAKPADQGTRKGLRLAGMLVAPLLVVALIASVFHLGTPMGAVRALRGVGSAWLSREIWVFGLLIVLAAAYGHLWRTGKSESLRRTLGYVSSVVGLAGVWVTAMVYALPSRPAWTPVGNTMTFLATALILGGLVVAFLVKRYGEEETAASVTVMAGGFATLVALSLMVVALATLGMDPQPQVAMSARATFGSLLFWSRLAFLLPPAAVAGFMVFRAQAVTTGPLSVALIGALTAELLGRALFYGSVMGPNLWGM